MYVIHTKTGKQIKAVISKLDAKEFTLIKNDKRFNFDWNKEKPYEVYKLTADGVDEILGLMSLEDRQEDYAIQIRLLAVSRENIGETKQFKRIAGCLIAFACNRAVSAGYGGYVCLKPKTELKRHYQEVYGMVDTKMYLITEGRNSLDLIKEYYED
jgi:hypothetical protein